MPHDVFLSGGTFGTSLFYLPLRTDERRAGVVVRENVGIPAAAQGHDVRAVLAHADAVAAARDGEGERPAAVCDGKRRRAQGKERAHLRARERLGADGDA